MSFLLSFTLIMISRYDSYFGITKIVEFVVHKKIHKKNHKNLTNDNLSSRISSSVGRVASGLAQKHSEWVVSSVGRAADF